jgi:hypothetical protein
MPGLDRPNHALATRRSGEQVSNAASDIGRDSICVCNNDHDVIAITFLAQAPRRIQQRIASDREQQAILRRAQFACAWPRCAGMAHKYDIIDYHFVTFAVLPVVLGARWTVAAGAAVGLPAGLA